MIIKISSDSRGTWNLAAFENDEQGPLAYTALGRSPWAIKALVHGILTDHAEPAAANQPAHTGTPCALGRGTAPIDGCPCVNCSLARPEPEDAQRDRHAGGTEE